MLICIYKEDEFITKFNVADEAVQTILNLMNGSGVFIKEDVDGIHILHRVDDHTLIVDSTNVPFIKVTVVP